MASYKPVELREWSALDSRTGITSTGPRRIGYSPNAFGQNGLRGASATKAPLRGTNPVKANKTNKEKHKEKNADKKQQAADKANDKQDKPSSQPS